MLTSSNILPRICFQNLCDPQWIAGCFCLKNLFFAIRALDRKAELVLLSPSPLSEETLAPYLEQNISIPAARWPVPDRIVYRLPRRLDFGFSSTARLRTLLRQQRINAMFVTYDHPMSLDVPLMVWIPDFQHVRLPEMFTSADIAKRDRQFIRAVQHAAVVIVSSQDTLQDFQKFAPDFAHKGRMLSFVAQIPPEVYESNPRGICQHYHLPERFVYLPNQFYRHKNHEVVLQALSILRETSPHICVVCTGLPHDSRFPSYSAELLAKISRLGLRDQIIILGSVPRQDVFLLMRQSLAVLQPSLFEGWGASIGEAKSLGKRVIASDLPVHQEQNPPGGLFFERDNPQSLADTLLRVYEEGHAGPDQVLEAQAREQLPVRTRAFGEAFMAITYELLGRGG